MVFEGLFGENAGEEKEFIIPAGKGCFYTTGHLIEGTAVFPNRVVLELELRPNNTPAEGFKGAVGKISPFLLGVLQGMGDMPETVKNLILAAIDARSGDAQKAEIEKLVKNGAYYDVSSDEKIFKKPLKVNDLKDLF